MKNICNTWFTLVELVVTIVILVILATVGFISYESYLVDARDSKRLSQMNNLRDGMRLFTTRGPLPIPDNNINIQSNGDVFAYQWYAGEDVLEAISYSLNTFDPLDEEFYTYLLSSNRKDFQLLWYLEESIEWTYYQDLQTWLYSDALANTYFIRYPKVFGKDMWVYILQNTLEPLQVVDKYKNLWYLDIGTDSGSLLQAVISDNQFLNGFAQDMAGLTPNSTCLTLYREYNYVKNGIYTINPTGSKPILVYCDMDEDGLWHGWGWTFTTFISTNWIARWAWDGTSQRAYQADRKGIGNSYGIDLKDIYHTEAYMIVDNPDLNESDLVENKVANFQYDYKNPILDPSIHFSLKPTSAMRWWFDGEFMPNHVHGWWDNYNNDVTYQWYINLSHGGGVNQGFRFDGDRGIYITISEHREDSFFYDTLSSAYQSSTWETPSKGWYYVR